MTDQLTLFAPEVRRTSNELMWELALSPSVEQAVLKTVAARPGNWLGWSDFRAIIDQHQIGSCFGHVLGHMQRAGLIRERAVYLGKGIGADTPGSGNYQGYRHEWSAV